MSDATSNDFDPSVRRRLSVSASCLAFFVLLAPAVQAVEFAGGTGEPVAPYQIATAEQLASIGDDPNLLDKYFILVSDIDLDPNLPGGRVFAQAVIAHEQDAYRSARVAYTGRFYGEGHTIRHLTIHGSGLQYLGLFGNIGSAGRVYGLTLEDVSIMATDRAGALAGLSSGGVVNCRVTGRICGVESSSWLGGLVGVNAGSITDCHAAVLVTGGDYSLMLGALVGMHRGGIGDCSATGGITGGYGSFYLGGLVGAATGGAIRDSFATGAVSGADASWGLGALVGRADAGGTIANCYATGSVTGGPRAHDLGGLVGSCYSVDVTHSYATGGVAGGDGSHSLGGLLGSALGTAVSDCYAAGDVNGFRTLGGFVGRIQAGTSLTNSHAAGRVLRNGTPWGRGGFAGVVGSQSEVQIVGCFWGVEVSGATISAAGAGLTTGQMQDASVFQAAGWDLAGERADGTADLWLVGAGNRYPVLTAFADVNQTHVLEGSGASFDPYLIATAEDLGAMRRARSSAWYRLTADIDLSGVAWANALMPVFSGFFDGHGHRITNLTIQGEKAGHLGLFGRIKPDAWVYDLGLENVSIVLPDGARAVGGLAGENAGYVVNCYVTGAIFAGNECRSVGGLVGVNWLGVIADCYTAVDVQVVQTGTQVGGLLGYNYLGTLASCYAAGRVSGPDVASLGALVGRSSENARTFSCYYLVSADGGGPDRGAGTAATAEQLRQASTFVDWDFDNTWMLCEGQTYPHLRWEGLSCQ
ncbi:MAG: hypothetical protein JW993_19735 [Sedimentisphaerales bacterium]|nr:hypothetical protein [Sedimentisphaerales bacterium]